MTFTVIQIVTTVTALPYFNKTVLKYGQKLSITKDNKIKGHQHYERFTLKMEMLNTNLI